MPKPRVVLLHNFLTPYRIPLFEELSGRFDLEVWILGNVRSIRQWPDNAPGATFSYRNLPRVEVPLGSRYNSLILNYSLPFEFRKARPDVIICWGWDCAAMFYAGLHALLAGIPFVLVSMSTPAEQTFVRSVTRPLVTALVRSCRAWVASGSRAEEYLVSLGAAPERVFRAYNTVDQAFFASGAVMTEPEREALKAKLGITTPHVALYCGNLLDLKGVCDLLPAFAKFARVREDVTLLLVGSGAREADYRAFCEEQGLSGRVVFAGFVQQAQLPPYYGIADLLVLPSRSEIWGLVINEAMACGVPVLTTDAVGAAPDMIREGENGYVVPARNPEALCGALERFFSDSTDREAMGNAARSTAAAFTFPRMADAFVEAVQCALRGT